MLTINRTKINLYSEVGRLDAVMLHRPGPEIEAMTPASAAEALYSDILSRTIAEQEYSNFAAAIGQSAKIYYVDDLLEELLEKPSVRQMLVTKSCELDGCTSVVDELMQMNSHELARVLVEGFPYRKGKDDSSFEQRRYLLRPLYNLFFTRDAASCLYGGVLENSMSFDVRRRESLIYKAIFEHYFSATTFKVENIDPLARTEGGDVMPLRENLMCVGNGIRTNKQGIEVLLQHFGSERGRFVIISQELPQAPDSFIHLDMVFTLLGTHTCMTYQPMLTKQGLFAGLKTMLHTYDAGKITHREYPNILQALASQGIDLEPVFCGGIDQWHADREQWHSGANFFALGENHIIGYQRNRYTIEALSHAGFEVLDAADVAHGERDPWSYAKAVVTFPASELPRAGGGARCMTCPLSRQPVEW